MYLLILAEETETRSKAAQGPWSNKFQGPCRCGFQGLQLLGLPLLDKGMEEGELSDVPVPPRTLAKLRKIIQIGSAGAEEV